MSAHFHFLPVAAADVSSVGFFFFFLISYLIRNQVEACVTVGAFYWNRPPLRDTMSQPQFRARPGCKVLHGLHLQEWPDEAFVLLVLQQRTGDCREE